MTTRLPAALAFLFFLGPFEIEAVEPGWGVIINRASRRVALHVTNSEGRTSSRRLAPNGALRLRKDVKYIVTVRESRFAATVDAQPMKFIDSSLFSPKWEPAEFLYNDAAVGFHSAWSLRCYQVMEINGRPELRSGFSTRDVNRVVQRYRQRMFELGFDPSITVAYQPYDGHLAESREAEEGISRHEIGTAARRLQHRTIADAILSYVQGSRLEIAVPEARNFAWDIPAAAINEFEFFLGEEEIQKQFPLDYLEDPFRQELSRSKVVVNIPDQVSPEIHHFARNVMAKILGVQRGEVGIVGGRAAAAVPSGPFFLREALTRNPSRIVERIQSEIVSAINKNAFVRTLRFANVQLSSGQEDVFGEQHTVTRLQTHNDWRYHRISDDVSFMDHIPAMRGMDLRWRLAVECILVGLRSPEPRMAARAQVEVQTKRRLLGRDHYRPWGIGLSEFWIEPRGRQVGPVDVEAVSFQLQNDILERCVEQFDF